MKNGIFFSTMFSIFVSIYCAVHTNNTEYEYIFLWPLAMVFIQIYLYLKKIKSISIFIVTIVSYIKFTVMPFVIVKTNSYSLELLQRNETSYYIKAIFLELYCLIALYFFLILFNKLFIKPKVKNANHNNISVIGDRYIYYFIFIISIILFIFVAVPNNLLSLFVIRVNNDGHRLDENIPLNYMIIRQFIVCSFNLVFIYLVFRYQKIYVNNSKLIYIFFPLLFAILNIGLITGERRSLQIYTALTCISILFLYFKNHRKFVIYFITLFSTFILLGMTIYKHLNAFVYSSYTKAIQVAITTGKDATGWGLANTMQVYFYGPQSISTALAFTDLQNSIFKQLVFDLSRSTIGISFFVKEKGVLLSAKYNHFLFNSNSVDTGHIIPNSVYGYTFFGFLFAPIFFVICALIVTILEKTFLENKYVEIKFVSIFILYRMCVDIYSNFPQTLSVATLVALSYFTILICIVLIKRLIPTKNIKVKV